MSTVTETAIAIAISVASVLAGLALYKNQIRKEVVSELEGKMRDIEEELKEKNKNSIADITKRYNEDVAKYQRDLRQVEEQFQPIVEKDCGAHGRIAACVSILAQQRKAIRKVHEDHLPSPGAVAGRK